MGRKLRIFVAHPKGASDDALNTAAAEILTCARAQLPNDEITVTLGRDDYAQSFSRFGGWNGWIASVAAGTEHRDGRLGQRFDVLVTTTMQLGRATASMLNHARSKGKPVLYFTGTDFAPVTNIVQRDGGDYQSGWEIIIPHVVAVPTPQIEATNC